MKPYSCVFIIFLLFVSLLVSSSASGRLLATKQGEKEAVTNEISQAGSSTKIREAAFTDLMGSEECDEKDEECLKRRMIGEAHLDYIYTQHHKP